MSKLDNVIRINGNVGGAPEITKAGKRRLKVIGKTFPREYHRYVIFPKSSCAGSG